MKNLVLLLTHYLVNTHVYSIEYTYIRKKDVYSKEIAEPDPPRPFFFPRASLKKNFYRVPDQEIWMPEVPKLNDRQLLGNSGARKVLRASPLADSKLARVERFAF